jgi:hypothetical protein
VELAFLEKALRDLCTSRTKAERRFGPAVATKLLARLADLRAATNIRELPVSSPYPAAQEGQLALDIDEGVRLIFCANGAVPKTSTGQVDWAEVTRIKILTIEDVR